MIGGLLPQHAALIKASAIAPEVAAARGYRSVTTKAQLKTLGLPSHQQRVPALVIPIHGVDGRIVQVQVRPDEPRTIGGKEVKYETPTGSRMVLDVPPPCRQALGDPSVPLYVTEGARKADAAASVGLCCVAILGVWSWRGSNKAGGKVALADWESVALNGRLVNIVFDSDVTTKSEVRTALQRFKSFLESRGASVHIVRLPAGASGSKTGLDDYLAEGHSVEDLVALGTDDDLSGSGASSDEAKSQPEPPRRVEPPLLAYDGNILDRFADELARTGVVGERPILLLIYLVIVTRLFPRIVSLAIKGPSSGGKSHLLDRVLEYFPASAYYVLSGMSEHALVYDDEPLAHRMLVIYEASGMAGDLQTYFIRSLLSEGRIRYATVIKGKDGPQKKLIDRPGPTGLLTTTTAVHLHPENETRLVSVTVTDTAEQTRAIMLAQAGLAPPADVEPWQHLQAWLETTDPRTSIPYARALAGAIPPVAVRLRRDFPAVLALIKAHALLHQLSRERDAEGAIVATLGDYAVVREVVASLVGEAAERTVPPTVRETVIAVQELTSDGAEAMVLAIGTRLGLDKSAASRRVRVAIDRGFLRNLEERRGRPHRIVLGDPLPDDETILPAVSDLERLHGCTVSEGDTQDAPDDAPRDHAGADTPSSVTATVQPQPNGVAADGSPFVAFGRPLGLPRSCPSCRRMHSGGITCAEAAHAPEKPEGEPEAPAGATEPEIDLVAEAYRIFGDDLVGGTA